MAELCVIKHERSSCPSYEVYDIISIGAYATSVATGWDVIMQTVRNEYPAHY